MPPIRNLLLTQTLLMYENRLAQITESSRSVAPYMATLAIHDVDEAVTWPQQGGVRLTWENLKAMQPQECLWHFRFYAEEIFDLAVALCIPNPFVTSSRSRFTSVEALALLMARFRSAGDMYHLVMTLYDRSQSAISEVVNELTVYLDEKWKHLLDVGEDNPQLKKEELAKYASAIHDAGSPLTDIWGFVDCTYLSSLAQANINDKHTMDIRAGTH
ncbi:hypothetical protein EV361DRAFT_1036723 [Lentinula raphanica]|nr:hypothetical protein EV361DRAFT_1036723 [Lentinula raphanica]